MLQLNPFVAFHILSAASSPVQLSHFECPVGFFPPAISQISLPLAPQVSVSDFCTMKWLEIKKLTPPPKKKPQQYLYVV